MIDVALVVGNRGSTTCKIVTHHSLRKVFKGLLQGVYLAVQVGEAVQHALLCLYLLAYAVQIVANRAIVIAETTDRKAVVLAVVVPVHDGVVVEQVG